MSNTSTRLNLPYILPSQAQKHVTHNEALQIIDRLVQMRLVETGATLPPAAPDEGAGYGLGTGASGAWAGQDGSLAFWQNGAWTYVLPQEGWCAWHQAASELLVYSAGAWQPVATVLENLSGLGVGTTSDPVNRLAVSSEASLFNHDGAGHQIKINKDSIGETASLLYQSNWTGHAEMGLTGDNNFHIKVSADGTSWTDAMTMNAATGHITGSAVQQSPADITPGRLARADYTYGPGNLVGAVSMAGGLPTGSALERGSNANGEYVRFADGTQVCMTESATFVRETGNSLLFDWTSPAEFLSGTARFSSYCIGNSSADWVAIDPMDIGVLRQFPTSDGMRITRSEGAPAFPANSELRNVRVVSWGRWA